MAYRRNHSITGGQRCYRYDCVFHHRTLHGVHRWMQQIV
jgi:hypothetical protein